MPRLRVNFNLYNRREEQATVLLTATVSGKRIRFSLGITIDPRYWDKKKKRLNKLANLDPTHPKGINEKLDKWELYAQTIYAENTAITADDFKNRLADYLEGKKTVSIPNAVKNTLDGFAAYEVERLEATNKKRHSVSPYRHAANYLVKFAKHRRRPIYWHDLNSTFVDDFRQFLERPEFDLAHNYIINLFRRTRSLIKKAGPGANGLKYHPLGKDDLPEFPSLEETPYKHYFSFEELGKMLAIDYSKHRRLEKVRDLFVLNCFTGLRRSDAKRVSREHFVKLDDGTELIKIYTQKTSSYVRIPLLPPAKKILEKYEWHLPSISDAKYNKYIKEVAKDAGINDLVEHTETRAGEVVTKRFEKWEKTKSHDARRSFATNFFEHGFSPGLLMQITDHKYESTFMKYICTSPEKAAVLMAKRYKEQDLDQLFNNLNQ